MQVLLLVVLHILPPLVVLLPAESWHPHQTRMLVRRICSSFLRELLEPGLGCLPALAFPRCKGLPSCVASKLDPSLSVRSGGELPRSSSKSKCNGLAVNRMPVYVSMVVPSSMQPAKEKLMLL
jgi:hypothetical protein